MRIKLGGPVEVQAGYFPMEVSEFFFMGMRNICCHPQVHSSFENIPDVAQKGSFVEIKMFRELSLAQMVR